MQFFFYTIKQEEDAEQTARMHRVIYANDVRMLHKAGFLMTWLILILRINTPKQYFHEWRGEEWK